MVILIVDDDGFFIEKLKSILNDLYKKARTITFIEAYNSDDAKEKIFNLERIDIAFIDLRLPISHIHDSDDYQSGLELIRYLKDEVIQERVFKQTKIFAMTHYSDDVTKESAKEFGADDYIKKEIEDFKMKNEIKEVLINQNLLSDNNT